MKSKLLVLLTSVLVGTLAMSCSSGNTARANPPEQVQSTAVSNGVVYVVTTYGRVLQYTGNSSSSGIKSNVGSESAVWTEIPAATPPLSLPPYFYKVQQAKDGLVYAVDTSLNKYPIINSTIGNPSSLKPSPQACGTTIIGLRACTNEAYHMTFTTSIGKTVGFAQHIVSMGEADVNGSITPLQLSDGSVSGIDEQGNISTHYTVGWNISSIAGNNKLGFASFESSIYFNDGNGNVVQLPKNGGSAVLASLPDPAQVAPLAAPPTPPYQLSNFLSSSSDPSGSALFTPITVADGVLYTLTPNRYGIQQVSLSNNSLAAGESITTDITKGPIETLMSENGAVYLGTANNMLLCLEGITYCKSLNLNAYLINGVLE